MTEPQDHLPLGELKTAGVTIRQGHALDLITGVKQVDLIATDPPYAFSGEGAEHALGSVVANVLRESAYRLRKGGWAVVFAASSWRSTYYVVESVRGILEPIRIGTWAKPAAKTKVRTPGWAWASVNVIVFRRPGAPGAGVPSEMLDYIVEPPLMVGRRAQLPDRVARWAVQPFTVPGGVMLDPFSGSGVLCRTASEAGMTAVGFEMTPPKSVVAPLPVQSDLFELGEAS